MIKRSARITLLITTMITGVIAIGYNVRGRADGPLTASEIVSHWSANPQQDIKSYIVQTVQERGVAFLPTNRIRHELCKKRVPIDVINALKFHVHDSDSLQFQVWRFDTKPGTLTPDQATRLAEVIVQQLQNRTSELSGLFSHSQAPLPDPCVQPGESTDCLEAKGPLLRVRGTIKRSGAAWEANVALAYVSRSVNPPEDQQIGSGSVTTMILRGDAEGLMRAANGIVSRLHQTLKQELTEPFACS